MQSKIFKISGYLKSIFIFVLNFFSKIYVMAWFGLFNGITLVYLMEYQLLTGYLMPKFDSSVNDYNLNYLKIPSQLFFYCNDSLLVHSYVVLSIPI